MATHPRCYRMHTLIEMMVRFHAAAAEGQPINPDWDARLSSLSAGFRNLGQDTAAAMGRSRWANSGNRVTCSSSV